jgi:hypothetical protein
MKKGGIEMSSVSPDTDDFNGDFFCASCFVLMNDNGTYPPLCSKQCVDDYYEDDAATDEGEQS